MNNASNEKKVSLWRNRDYLLLWLGQAVSSLGTGMTQFAFPLLILVLTNNTAVAGFAGALGWLPYVFFSLPAGALVDRWQRKRIMIGCTVGLILCLASIPLALLYAHLTIAQIYLVSFLMGTLALFYDLAELAALTQLVAKTQLPDAVTQNEAVYSGVSLLAPSLGGLLLSIRTALPFVADVFSYFVLLGSLLCIRSSLDHERDNTGTHLLAEMREGVRWLWSHVVVRWLAWLTGYLYVAISGSFLIVFVIARQQHIASGVIGIIVAAGGIGNLIGTALSAPYQRRLPFGRALGLMMLGYVLFWPWYGFVRSPLLIGIVFAALALVDSIANILIASYRMVETPEKLQGRVASVYRLILYSTIAAGQALIGIGLQRLGVLATLGILWSGLVCFALLVLVHPLIRKAAFTNG